MAEKGFIRSIRISDDMAELIDKQAGKNFTEKWENLVTRCVWELPEREKELEALEKRIASKKQEMAEASNRYARMLKTLQDMEPKMRSLEWAIERAVTNWDDEEM